MARRKNSRKVSDLGGDPFSPKITLRSKELTENQKKFLKLALHEKTNIIFIGGPAGSTKTYIAVYAALRLLQKSEDLDLFYVRTAIESADKGLGALPGSLEEKFNPYMAPLQDKLTEILPKTTGIKGELLNSQRIQAMPINYLRGSSWNNKIVIADESQNFTFKELITLITRIGRNTKLFICGDFMQSDINGKTGFEGMYNLFNDEESRGRNIHCFKFTAKDIKRSEILKYIISKLQKK
jgi:phosphate starvation-inducible PhoH-like protein